MAADFPQIGAELVLLGTAQAIADADNFEKSLGRLFQRISGLSSSGSSSLNNIFQGLANSMGLLQKITVPDNLQQLQVQAQGGMQQAVQALKAYEDSTKAVEAANAEMITSFTLVGAAAAAALVVVGKVMSASGQEGMIYEQSAKNIQIATTATADEMERLHVVNLGLASSYGVPINAIAQFEQTLARSGQDVEAIINGEAAAVIELSKVTGTSFDQSSKLIANSLNAFSSQGVTAQQVADSLAVALNKSTLTSDQFGTALATLSNQAQTLHIPFAQVVTLITAAGQSGATSSRDINNLSNVLTNLITPTASVTKQVAGLKDQIVHTYNGSLDLIATLQNINNTYGEGAVEAGKLTQAQADQNMQLLTGASGARDSALALTDLTRGYNQLYSEISKHNTAQNEANQSMDTTSGRLDQLGARWHNVLNEISPVGKAIKDVGTFLAQMALDTATNGLDRYGDSASQVNAKTIALDAAMQHNTETVIGQGNAAQVAAGQNDRLAQSMLNVLTAEAKQGDQQVLKNTSTVAETYIATGDDTQLRQLGDTNPDEANAIVQAINQLTPAQREAIKNQYDLRSSIAETNTALSAQGKLNSDAASAAKTAASEEASAASRTLEAYKSAYTQANRDMTTFYRDKTKIEEEAAFNTAKAEAQATDAIQKENDAYSLQVQKLHEAFDLSQQNIALQDALTLSIQAQTDAFDHKIALEEMANTDARNLLNSQLENNYGPDYDAQQQKQEAIDLANAKTVAQRKAIQAEYDLNKQAEADRAATAKKTLDRQHDDEMLALQQSEHIASEREQFQNGIDEQREALQKTIAQSELTREITVAGQERDARIKATKEELDQKKKDIAASEAQQLTNLKQNLDDELQAVKDNLQEQLDAIQSTANKAVAAMGAMTSNLTQGFGDIYQKIGDVNTEILSEISGLNQIAGLQQKIANGPSVPSISAPTQLNGSGAGAAPAVTNNSYQTNYNVDANYANTQSPSSVAMDLQAMQASAR